MNARRLIAFLLVFLHLAVTVPASAGFTPLRLDIGSLLTAADSDSLTKKGGGYSKRTTETTTLTDTTERGFTTRTGKDGQLDIQAKGDITLQGGHLAAGSGGIHINSTEGKIRQQTENTGTTAEISKENNYRGVWGKSSQRSFTSGESTLTEFDTLGPLTLEAAGGIDTERPGPFQYGTHDHHSGITAFGAAVVTVIVSAVTYGAASGAVGSALGSSAGSTFAAASNLAVQGLSNNGSIQWNEVFKAALVAGVTAGLTNGQFFNDGTQSLNDMAGLTTNSYGFTVAKDGGFALNADQMLGLGGRALINAGLDTAVNDGKFAKSFGLSIANDFGAIAAHNIGSAFGDGKDPFLQIASHTGLGAALASANGKDVAAGAIGGLVEGVLSNVIPYGSIEPGSLMGSTLYTAGAMTAAGLMADRLGRDPESAAFIAKNAAQNNYLYSNEAKRLDELKQLQGKGGCDAICGQEIKEIETRDRERNAQLNSACINPSSSACGEARKGLQAAANSYIGQSGGLDLYGIFSRERSEASTLNELYTLRANNPAGFNAGLGAAQSLVGGAVGLVEFTKLSVQAATGNTEAQNQLGQMVKNMGEFLSSPIDNTERAIKNTLDQANQLEAAGRVDEAQRLRASLATDGLLTVSAAGAIVIKGGRAIATLGTKAEEVAGGAAKGGARPPSPVDGEMVTNQGTGSPLNVATDAANTSKPIGMTTSNDGIATWIKVADDPRAVVRVVSNGGAIKVTDIYSGGLPSGSGSQMLAEGLKTTGLKSGGQFELTGIINTETLAAYEHGVSASDSLLGKVATNALDKMGLKPSSIQYNYDPIRDKLAITVGVQ